MSPDKLINRLEALGSIDRKIIAKLRDQVESSDKPVKATSILKFLIKKDYLSEAEAKKILKSDPTPATRKDQMTRVAEPDELLVDDPAGNLEVAEIENSLSGIMEPPPIDPDTGLVTNAENAVGADQFTDGDLGREGKPAEENTALGAFRKNDQKNQWESKWPLIGSGLLVLVVGLTLFLSFWWAGASADKQYEAALQSLNNATFEDAVKKFDEFIKSHPSDKNIDQAKSYRVQGLLRSKFDSKQWMETIVAGQELLPPLAAEPDNKLDTIRDDIGYMLVESLYNESETAVELKELAQMEAASAKLEGYWKFIDNPVYLSTTTRKGQTVSKLIAETENNRSTIIGLIEKEKSYTRTMAEIKEKGDNKKTDEAFATYIKLTRTYPDLAARTELREAMKKISDAEQSLVSPLENTVNSATDSLETDGVTTIVLAATTGKPVNGLRGEVVTVLVDGAIYGFNVSTGRIAWRQFVGLETSFQPERYDIDSVIASDVQRNEVSRLQVKDGQPMWRASIGEPFHEPNFSETQVAVTTHSGKLILLDGDTGEMIGGSQLPQITNTGAMLAKRLPLVYQTGSYSNLYAISTTTFDCKSVLYIGHAQNSIQVPPISWSGYLVVARNGGDFADLLVFKPDESGLNLKLAQVVNRVTDAPISKPIEYFGRGLLLFADNGDLRVLELNPGNETAPVSVRAKKRFETEGQEAHAAFQGTKLWAAGKGLRRYKVQRNLGQFKDEEVVEPGDTFLAAPIVLDDNLFHVRRRLGSSMVSASLVDAMSLEPVWRTDFGGAVAGVVGNNQTMAAVTNQGDVLPIDSNALQSGLSSKAVIASEVIEDLTFETTFQSADTLYAVSANDGSDLLSYEFGSDKSRLNKMGIEPGDVLTQAPLLMDGQWVVVTRQGQVAKLELDSGTLSGSPFLPPVSPGMSVPWQPLLKLDEQHCVAGHSAINTATGVTPSMLYFLSIENSQSVQKMAELTLDNSLVSGLLANRDTVYGIVSGETSDELITVSTGRTPSVEKTEAINARLVDGPWLAGQTILLQNDQDELVAYDLNLQRLWSKQIGNVRLAGPPDVTESRNILVSFNNGTLAVVDPSDGKQVATVDIAQPLAKPATRIGNQFYLPGTDGTVHVLDGANLK